ncbi:hypothetical protein ACA910_015908 [Epithemia clementina (nom. ined.)]
MNSVTRVLSLLLLRWVDTDTLSLSSSSFSWLTRSTSTITARTTTKLYGSHPRIVQFDFETRSASQIVGPFPTIFSSKNSTAGIIGKLISRIQDKKEEKCQPMHQWQTHSYTTCNPIHEFSIQEEFRHDKLHLIACGGDRCTFRLDDPAAAGTGEPPLAFKVIKADEKGRFSKRMLEASRKDGMVMERLSQSPYVLSTYGYCGLSQVLEYADGGSIHDLMKRGRNFNFQMAPIDKLRIAYQLVSAVADLHSVEGDDHAPSITHNDLCCHQFVSVKGVYKLNDFHLAYLVTQNKETGNICWQQMTVAERWALIHAPEESMNEYSVFDNAKADDYTVGNIMFYVLTYRWIFEFRPNAVALQHLHQGLRPPFPKSIQESNDPADRALMTAINMTWTHAPNQRPSSRQVSNYLMEQLEKITGETVNGPVRVSLPPLPESWDYGEDPTFDANFD